MKRRIVTVIVSAAALATLAGPASAVAATTSSYWGCVGNHDLDLGICVKDPLPEVPTLPLPRLPQ